MATYGGLEALRKAHNNEELNGRLASDVMVTEVTISQADEDITADVSSLSDISLHDRVAHLSNTGSVTNISNSITVQWADRTKGRTSREEDDIAERGFDAYLQENIYPLFVQMGFADKIESVYDQERQCKGSDAIFYVKGHPIRVDNKNRASVCNKENHRIPYELFTNNRNGYRIVGWGGDKEKDTDYICAMHCFVDNTGEKINFNSIAPEQIKRIEFHFYKLDDMRHYFDAISHPLDELLKEAKAFENNFRDKYANTPLVKIPNTDRSKKINWDAAIYTSYYKFAENSTVALIKERVVEQFPNSRRFVWTEKNGLVEALDKRERPPLTPSERKPEVSRISCSTNGNLEY